MVGFNRRFAPQVREDAGAARAACRSRSAFVMTVNAGAIPAEHWTQDREVGGGRIVGEACHFIDLLRFLAGAPIESHAGGDRDGRGRRRDTRERHAELRGRLASAPSTTSPTATRRFPKERLEVFAAGRVLQLDNFRRLRGFGWPGFRAMNLWRQDKGQAACARAFVEAVRSGGSARSVGRTTGSEPRHH